MAGETCTHYRDVKIAQTASFFTHMRTKYELHLCQQCNGFLLHKVKNILPAEVKAYRAPEILESSGSSKKQQHRPGTSQLTMEKVHELVKGAQDLND